MNQLQVFSFESKVVRTQIDENGNPWWVAKDVCEVLAISSHRDSISSIADKYKRRVKVDGRDAVVINESGLYKFVLKSKKPNAEKFQDWVVEDVLPSIRKTGGYSTGVSWKIARQEGKLVRKLTTDIIATFIEYARKHGSSSPEMYYQNFSKMVNASLLEVADKKPKNLRDHLNVIQLHTLSVAENIIAKSLVECMAKGLPYKDIYQIAKSKIQTYAETVGRTRIGQSETQTMGLLA